MQGGLTVLDRACEESSYLLANHAIVDEAIILSAHLKCAVCAVSVWEGDSRGPGDLTAEFRTYATSLGVRLLEDINTLGPR